MRKLEIGIEEGCRCWRSGARKSKQQIVSLEEALSDSDRIPIIVSWKASFQPMCEVLIFDQPWQ